MVEQYKVIRPVALQILYLYFVSEPDHKESRFVLIAIKP